MLINCPFFFKQKTIDRIQRTLQNLEYDVRQTYLKIYAKRKMQQIETKSSYLFV